MGSRLRLLSEKVTEDAAAIYDLYDIDLQPKWFPVFYVLSQEGEKTVTAIAREIGHSHPSVSKIISEMAERQLITEQKDKTDGRRNIVSLSAKGMAITGKIQEQYRDVELAIAAISDQASHDLWKAIEEWEFLLEQKSLLRRVKEQQRKREAQRIRITDYAPCYQQAFRKPERSVDIRLF